MEGADDGGLAMAALVAHHPRAAVAADIVEAAHHPILAADGERPLPHHIQGQIVARRRDIADMAHQLPAAAEQLVLLDLQELEVEIGPPGQPAALALAQHMGGFHQRGRGGVQAGHGRPHATNILIECSFNI
jgi:hypothetical protein